MKTQLNAWAKRAILFLFLAAFTVAVTAQSVDFSGKWKLNSSKSSLNYDFSMAPKQLVITQGQNSLSVERFSEMMGQSMNYTDKFTLDGKETMNEGFGGMERKSVAKWSDDKKSLVIVTKVSSSEFGEVTVTETYKIDSDNLSITSVASSSMGELDEVFVFDKE